MMNQSFLLVSILVACQHRWLKLSFSSIHAIYRAYLLSEEYQVRSIMIKIYTAQSNNEVLLFNKGIFGYRQLRSYLTEDLKRVAIAKYGRTVLARKFQQRAQREDKKRKREDAEAAECLEDARRVVAAAAAMMPAIRLAEDIRKSLRQQYMEHLGTTDSGDPNSFLIEVILRYAFHDSTHGGHMF